MNKDLTVGKPEQVLWQFCLPLLGSILFQQMYNLADSLIAGRFLGEEALAAVGNSYEITLIFIALAFGCNIGCSVLVSQLFGAKEYHRMKTAIYTAGITSGVLCLGLMILGMAGCDRLLTLIHTPDEIWKDSKTYLDIYLLGLPFLFFYNIATGIFSAMGDSKTPFWFLAFSSSANVVVNILFVTTFQMGVAGLAWATFLCQGISCVLAVVVILRRLRRMETKQKPKIFSSALLRRFLVIAIPSMLQQSFISVGNIIIQGVINGFGSGVIAGYAAAVKLNNLIITLFTTLGNAVSNFSAQNLGANRRDRVRASFPAGRKIGWMICIPAVLLYVIGGKYLLYLFMETPTEDALQAGMQFLRVVAPFYFVISVKLVADGVLRGTGRMNQFMIATFTDLILRVVLALTLSGTALKALGIWCAWPVGWCVATVLSVMFFCKGPGKPENHPLQ